MSAMARRRPRSLVKSAGLLRRGIAHIARNTKALSGLSPAAGHRGHQSLRILETRAWRLGVVLLGPAARIPLHDHPGAYTVSHVLAGEVTIDSFSAVAEQQISRLIRLRQSRTDQLGAGASAVLDPWETNIHRLCASRGGTVLLTGAFAHGSALRERRWFFPVRWEGEGTVEAAVVQR